MFKCSYVWFVSQAILASTLEKPILMSESEAKPSKQADHSSVELVTLGPSGEPEPAGLRLTDTRLDDNETPPESEPPSPSSNASLGPNLEYIEVTDNPGCLQQNSERLLPLNQSVQPVVQPVVKMSESDAKHGQSEDNNKISDVLSAARMNKQSPRQAELKLVVAVRSFAAPKPKQQLSFAKGDVIRVVRDTGKWHLGVIHRAADSNSGSDSAGSATSTSQAPLFFPPNFVKPFKSSQSNTRPQPGSTRRASAVPATLDSQNNPKESEPTYVKAKSAFIARKPHQLSFAKGDIIQLVDTGNGKWHKGKLVRSSQYPLTTEKALFYPSNFVQPTTFGSQN